MVAEGREPPAQYFKQPEIPEHLQFYWFAFFELGTERQIGMGLGPIPRSAIRDYANEWGIHSVDEFDRFSGIIGALDDEFLSTANATSKTDKPVDDGADGPHRVFDSLKARAKAKHGKRDRK